jgi:hypothetical protein
MAVNFERPKYWGDGDLDALFYAQCRLGAILGTMDPFGTSREVISPDVAEWDWKTTVQVCQEEAKRRFDLEWSSVREVFRLSAARWVPIESPTFDEEATYGVLRHQRRGDIAIPLKIGQTAVAYFVCNGVKVESDWLRRVLTLVTAVWANVSFPRCAGLHEGFVEMEVAPHVRSWQPKFRWPNDDVKPTPRSRRRTLFTEVPEAAALTWSV